MKTRMLNQSRVYLIWSSSDCSYKATALCIWNVMYQYFPMLWW